jgi:hypothetical protein
MTIKHLSLRRSGACSVCGNELQIGTLAWWDREARSVTCESCRPSSETPKIQIGVAPVSVDPSPPIPEVQSGVAGRSALEEFEKRHDAREARIDAKFGRLAGVVKFLTDDPQSITAWKKGSVGERKLAASLEQSLGDRVILLHDRQVPKTRGNIDHLVIAGSGVWVVDAKNYSGLVQQRDVGGLFKVDNRLYVGRRDCTKLVDGLGWQVRAVTKALGADEVPVSSSVCFTDAEWRLFAKPFTLKDVFVSGPNALARKISETSSLSMEQIRAIAVHLSTALPAKD